MRIRNNNPLDLEGAQGEQITVSVDSMGTQNLVSYTLDGHTTSLPQTASNSFDFTLDKTVNNPSVLTMLFTFSGSDGGNYDISISGSEGGQTSHYSVTQFFGIPGDSITYTFDVR